MTCWMRWIAVMLLLGVSASPFMVPLALAAETPVLKPLDASGFQLPDTAPATAGNSSSAAAAPLGSARQQSASSSSFGVSEPNRLINYQQAIQSNGRIEARAQHIENLQNTGFIAREYLLGPNDVVSLVFPFVEEMNQENIRVLPDGTVHLALVGSVNVSGMSLQQLREMLVNAYQTYLVNPEVTVNLSQSKPFIVQVTGAVLNPGVYELNTMTEQAPLLGLDRPESPLSRRTPLLSNILTAAGGIRYDSDLQNIRIRNTISQKEIKVDLLALLDGDLSNDVYLVPGDSIHVPVLDDMRMVPPEHYKQFANATFSQKKVPVKVYGYVNRPGLIELDPAQTLTLNSAITAAGGYMLDSAYAPKQVIISRRDVDGNLASMSVNPREQDVALMPNDMVYVPQKLIPRVGLFFDFLSRVVNPAAAVVGAANGWAFLANPTRGQIRGN